MKLTAVIFCSLLVVLSTSCSRRGEYLERRPTVEEMSGLWRSTDRLSGASGEPMLIKINPDKSCEITAIPVYDVGTRNYRVISGRGTWMLLSAGTKGCRLNVSPYDTRLSASVDIMSDGGKIVLSYNTDPELPEWAIFRKQ